MDVLTQISRWIHTDRFLSKVDTELLDAMLDTRDEEAFETPWCHANDLIAAAGLEDDARVTAIREAAFKLTFKITNHPEFCGYVSDDFGLIADLARAEIDDMCGPALLSCYAEGKFPCEEVTAVNKSIAQIVTELEDGSA